MPRNPTPDEIRQLCEEIRHGWTLNQKRQRGKWAECPVKALDDNVCELNMLDAVECPPSRRPREGGKKKKRRKR